MFHFKQLPVTFDTSSLTFSTNRDKLFAQQENPVGKKEEAFREFSTRHVFSTAHVFKTELQSRQQQSGHNPLITQPLTPHQARSHSVSVSLEILPV